MVPRALMGDTSAAEAQVAPDFFVTRARLDQQALRQCQFNSQIYKQLSVTTEIADE